MADDRTWRQEFRPQLHRETQPSPSKAQFDPTLVYSLPSPQKQAPLPPRHRPPSQESPTLPHPPAAPQEPIASTPPVPPPKPTYSEMARRNVPTQHLKKPETEETDRITFPQK